jgi:hypothetical protein
MRPQDIRKLVEQTFQSLRSAPQELTRETFLIREGHYCGHRYESDELSAVWFLEEDEIKVFGENGGLLLVLQPSQPPSSIPQRAA